VAIFISYARRDTRTVNELVSDVRRAQREAWFDQELGGGQPWWDAILERIRNADLFIFALSPDSVVSRACRAELAYAVACDRPLLPVLVNEVNVELAPDPIGATQIADYRERTPETAMALLMALERVRAAPPLPDPLPGPPPAPITDLGPLRDRLLANELSFAEQQQLLTELRRHVDNVDQHDTLLTLLESFRNRPDVVASVARDIDAVIAALPVTDEDWSPAQTRPTRRRLADRDPDVVDLLRALVAHIRARQFTPIVGPGMTDSLLGPRRLLARQWAKTFEFPMAKHQSDDLPDVAQFVTVMTNVSTLRASLGDYIHERLRAKSDQQSSRDENLDTLMRAAWDRQRAEVAHEPHVVMASLPCAIYICAHPWNVLADALTVQGKQPVVELCRWRPDVYDWPPSIFEAEPSFTPTVERPLVYHVFGTLDFPDSLVITEDDYFDFLIGVSQDRSLVPPAVRRVLADSALLLLGFGLEDWDVRVLLRTLVSQEGGRKLRGYRHVAAQIDLTGGVVSPARAQRYLERYFGMYREPSIDIYWGSVEEFTEDLAELWSAPR
jgi:hypothetical protein